MRVPRLYEANASLKLAAATYGTAAITRTAFRELLDTGGRLKGLVEELQLGLPVTGIDAEPKLQHIDSPPPPRKGRKAPVVVGVIDSGFAFAHRRFCTRDGPRAASRPSGTSAQGGAPRIRSPPSAARPQHIADIVPYGTELLGAGIDQLRGEPRPAGIDEDSVYRKLQYHGADLRASHGTHVLDLACGYGPDDPGPATGLPRIVCVALPRQTTADTAGLSLGVYALDALRYILDRTDRLVPGANIVVNLSYGNIAGPHDGSSLLEQAIDELIRLRRKRGPGDRVEPRTGRLEVVIAAGNNHLSRCHAQLTLHANQTSKPLAWRILPDDATPSFIEIWVRKDEPPAKLAVQLTSPSGEASEWVEPGMIRELRSDGSVVASVIHLATGNRRVILVAAAPTVAEERARAVAPAGVWEVRMKRLDGGEPVEVNAWIQRDDNVHGFRRRGRQSYFDDPAYLRFDIVGRPVEEDGREGYVRRAGTLNAIGTGTETIVVGGYRGSDGAPALYSPRGPAAPGESRMGPDAMSVSERSVTRRGVLAAGTRSGSTVSMNGTSVAAPQVTRWIAEQLAASKPGTVAGLRARAKKDDPDPKKKPSRGGAQPTDPQPPVRGVKPKPPAARGGAGRIRLVPRGEDLPDTILPFVKR